MRTLLATLLVVPALAHAQVPIKPAPRDVSNLPGIAPGTTGQSAPAPGTPPVGPRPMTSPPPSAFGGQRPAPAPAPARA